MPIQNEMETIISDRSSFLNLVYCFIQFLNVNEGLWCYQRTCMLVLLNCFYHDSFRELTERKLVIGLIIDNNNYLLATTKKLTCGSCY